MSTLILLRHGESTWNAENLFTGWEDPPLSERGLAEARQAGRLMKAAGLAPGIVHTSLLQRSIETANLALSEMGRSWLPVQRHWRFNERHYGALQGLNKAETLARYGAEQVHLWRRSYDAPPPPLEPGDPRHPRNDPRYASIPDHLLPLTECLKDVVGRILPCWEDEIAADLGRGYPVLLVAHGNSLRALVKLLDGISDREIADLNIPTGAPLVYELDPGLKPLARRYLGDPAEVEARTAAVRAQAGSH